MVFFVLLFLLVGVVTNPTAKNYQALVIRFLILALVAVSLFAWAMSLEFVKDQAIFGQAAVLLGLYLVSVSTAKAMAIQANLRGATKNVTFLIVAADFLLPTAFLYVAPLDTVFW